MILDEEKLEEKIINIVFSCFSRVPFNIGLTKQPFPIV